MDPLDSVPLGPGGLLRRNTLLTAGFERDEIDRLVRGGRLLGIRPGVYRLPGETEPTSAELHRARAQAAAPELADDAVYGGVTAAVLLGLPLWRVPLGRLHVFRDRPGGGRIRPGTHVHSVPLPDQDVVELDGLRVTSAARTTVDLARTLGTEQALITLDAALHRHVRRDPALPPPPGAVDGAQLDDVLNRFAGRRGMPRARRTLALADALTESPGESRSRFHLHAAGIPAPVTQWEVPGLGYRTDFAWPEHGVVGEFDGRMKYGRTLHPDEDLEDVLWREKQREDRIRAIGLTVVRWTWYDIDGRGPNGMVPRLRRLLTVLPHPA
ncbi:hypothetical protein Ae406Ps2_3642 [Pseudonocardia sp. Ae406_Ps2]|uniref:type IV toxin-antitoxin system AbiEi family antitoxin domain-containing protein n=1 Tax=unclassified Pseudonocardia TaxID=2619320 RepID=UPI0002ECB828|nr:MULTISPECIES: type IV toxin-antitoxin system AbiEi family antitoxin domain-containing protein [unclassified Pseudonocardia]OLL98629.1 hypothetical protein Ae331Ps2_2296c [Pseudonocardia sp. Ae331_Ps2]OLM03642.1 hypothetical protein Ae406Ps2_3642 [Pseudonocardia sp. Ae406_Ps2]OLM11545.1 hypothetical protein Ae505Ps2_1669 [Pseudonocardia sp. Ae505_Ps2]OLM25201.1 hypothetical protein Ae706Ps2_3634 [Pseudonocardia sp. Ae706_Ps2]OLM34606.1 hypothetical protein Ae717Ps2_5502c [Pseudonocardia sp. 